MPDLQSLLDQVDEMRDEIVSLEQDLVRIPGLPNLLEVQLNAGGTAVVKRAISTSISMFGPVTIECWRCLGIGILPLLAVRARRLSAARGMVAN